MDEKESYVQKKLLDKLYTSFPAIYVRKIHQSQFSHAGIPDLIGCLRGEFFGIEVKRSSGRVTKLQDRELNFIEMAGGISLVCYGTEDIEGIIDELRVQT